MNYAIELLKKELKFYKRINQGNGKYKEMIISIRQGIEDIELRDTQRQMAKEAEE